MDHKPSCLIFICTCNVDTNPVEEQENNELAEILEGINVVKYTEDFKDV